MSKRSNTLYKHLLDSGFSGEEIEKRFSEDTSMRQVSLSYFKEDSEDDPVVGISYSGDFRYEEEAGLSTLGQRFASKEKQKTYVFKREVDGQPVYVFTASEARYEDDALMRRIGEALERHRNPYNAIPWRVYQKSVKALRAELKEKGVSPLPTKRADAEREYVKHVLGQDVVTYANVGEFHYGDYLVVVVGDEVLRAALDYLVDVSVPKNALTLGSSTNPFSRGVLIFDERDLLPKTIQRQKDEEAYYKKRMKAADSAVAALKENGYLYAIKPAHLVSVVYRDDLGEGDYYYVNYSPRGGKQVFGWFTLAELSQLADGSIAPGLLER